LSIKVMSWDSKESNFAKWKPTSPAPAIIIFIKSGQIERIIKGTLISTIQIKHQINKIPFF